MGDGDSPTEETPTVAAESVGGSTMETPTIESPMVDELSDASGGETTMETPTVESPAETTMETPTIETVVGEWGADESNDESGEPVEQTAEIDLDDLGLDLANITDDNFEDLDASARAADLEAPDFEAEFSPIDETGLKPQISGEEAGVDLDSDDESSAEDQAVKDVLDVEPTAQMQNVDLQSLSGDTVEQPTVGDTAEQPSIRTHEGSFDDNSFADKSGYDAGVDLDIGEDVALKDEIDEALDTSTAAVVEGATMTEVGTKLDLARAYIDMGDPDGARSILNEVLEEAADSQRQEAQKLLDDLGD